MVFSQTPNCQNDSDRDGIPDDIDNCPITPNADQEDIDGDDVGDVCDNCADDFNPEQEDTDKDSVGDACENCFTIDCAVFDPETCPSDMYLNLYITKESA